MQPGPTLNGEGPELLKGGIGMTHAISTNALIQRINQQFDTDNSRNRVISNRHGGYMLVSWDINCLVEDDLDLEVVGAVMGVLRSPERLV